MERREDVVAFIISQVRDLADSRDDEIEITEATTLFDEMSWRSLDLVVLANALQTHYQRVFPFDELMQGLAESGRSDLSVSDMADFVWRHLQSQRPEAQPESPPVRSA